MAKQPWLAVFLSLVLPGFGQIYGGNRVKGIIFVITYCFLAVFTFVSIFSFIFFEDTKTSQFSALIAITLLLISSIFSIYNLFDAHKIANKFNAKHNLMLEPVLKKKPWLAVFLSYIFPGIGQFYNGQLLKGASFLIFAILLSVAYKYHHFILLFILIFLLSYSLKLYSIKDAFDSAEKKNCTNRKLVEQGSFWLRVFILVCITFNSIPLGKIAKTNFIQAYKIPAGSMLPTLKIGDCILINKSASIRASIQRGDIVVFIYPNDRSKDFVKRVIGLGGETIEIKDKKIFINGQPYNDSYGVYKDNVIYPASVQPRDNIEPIKIHINSVFVMGDNRDESLDSRFYGTIPQEDIKGKVVKIYWSWDSENMSVRWDRIGKGMK